MTTFDTTTATWVEICGLADLVPGRGACALVGPYQVALFRVGDDVYAVSNYDPFSEAFVLSRGIVGSSADVVKVSSPVYKQSFDLRTGVCLDDPSVQIATFPVRVTAGRVTVGRP